MHPVGIYGRSQKKSRARPPLAVNTTKQFDRDYKRQFKRRGGDMQKLKKTIELLRNRTPLPPSHREHSLDGVWRNFKECHIGGEGDWLLIYTRTGTTLELARTGTHDELFVD